MMQPSGMIRPRRISLWLLLVLGLVAMLCSPAFVAAQDPPPATQPQQQTSSSGSSSDGNAMIDFLFKTVTGWVLLAVYFIFIGMLVWLFIDLRGGAMMPLDLVDALEDATAKRRLKDGFELVKSDGSIFARVMTAGMTRLQHGLQESRDAIHQMLDSLKARKKGIVGYVAIIGTLGPLIGLVGTVSGMIDSFGELGAGGGAMHTRLAKGISHALNATLIGIFLACLAIPSYAFFANRLDKISNEVGLMADDLLTQMHFASRSPAPAPAPAAARPDSSATRSPEPSRPP
jgi:biopolymer transport protein ExbB